MYAHHVIVKKMKFKHENYIIDLNDTSKAKLYRNNQLMFMGDGYRAITTMLKGCRDKEPVKRQFKAQLTMREKPKFDTSNDDIERMRREAEAALAPKNLKKKTIRHILQEIAFSRYSSNELNKFTRLKNRFNFDYNTEKINSLSKRELQVLKLFFRGKRNVEISKKLNINQKTVNTYITRIMKKLEVNSKTDLFVLAREHIKQPY